MAEPSFEEVCGDFRQFRGEIARAMAEAEDSPAKRELEGAVRSMDKHFAELQEAYPKAQAELDRQIADVRQQAAETQKSLDQSAAKLAEMEKARKAAEEAAAAKAKAPPPPKPVPKIDPGLGATLRAELLERFGLAPTGVDAPPPREGMHEVWEDWDAKDWSRE